MSIIDTYTRILPEPLLNLVEPVFLFDTKSRRIVDANDETIRLFGRDPRGMDTDDLHSFFSTCRVSRPQVVDSTINVDGHQRRIEFHKGRVDSNGLCAVVVIEPRNDSANADGSSAIETERVRAVMAERERFARDLHDGVTQEVIAASMSLAALVPLASEELQIRLEEVIDQQEAILHNLRKTVFALKEGSHHRVDALKAFARTIDESVSSLPYRPSIAIDGRVADIHDPAFLGSAVFALREMISNVCRHAKASEMEILIHREDDLLEVRVRDNGVGLGAHATRGNGLDNLEARANGAGGTFTITRLADGHTEACLRMPLPKLSRVAS